MENGLTPQEIEILKVLERMHEQALPTEEELEKIEVSPDFSEKMHRLIDEESARREKSAKVVPIRKKRLPLRWIGIAAALILILLVPYYEVIAQGVARFIFSDYDNQFVIEHVADWEESPGYSRINYTMPRDYELVEEMVSFIYVAHWRNDKGDEIEVGVIREGITNYDYEYADEIKRDVIKGTEVTYYTKFNTTVLFGIKDDYLVDVSGSVDYSVLKDIFASISFD